MSLLRSIRFLLILGVAAVAGLSYGSVRASVAPAVQGITPVGLETEYAVNPLGIDVRRPRLSWRLEAEERGTVQSAYQIQVAASPAAFASGRDLLWDTGKAASDEMTHIVYEGPALESRQRYYWRVQVWDGEDRPSAWSETAYWEMGLLDPEDWQAQWIGGRQDLDHDWSDLKVTFDFTFQPAAATPPPQPTGGFFGPPPDPEVNDIVPLNFLFRARPVGKTYGETYNWKITMVDGQPLLREQVRQYPGGSSSNTTLTTLKEVPISNIAAGDLIGKRHRMVVEATGSQIKTWIDGVLIDTITDDRQTSGTVGFQVPVPNTAVIHEVTVEVDGEIAFRTDFSGGANPFTAGRPTDEGLELNGGITGRGADKDAVLPISTPAPLLRKEFNVAGDVESARLYVAAGGWPDLSLNGRQVGDAAMETGSTAYDRRVLYRTYDVTDLLREEDNAIGVELGRGWYGVTVPNEWYFHMAGWHGNPILKAQLEITYADGERQVVTTDGSWRAIDGPTTDDSIYLGEKYDARLAPDGWRQAGYDDASWAPATVVDGPEGKLVAAQLEPIKVVGTIRPVAVTEPRPGTFVFDFGRIFAGWTRLNVSGPAGQTVSLVHSEKLNPDGTVQPAGGLIDGQLQTDYYTLAGGGPEQWEPHFNYKGFRYVQVEGFPGTPTLDALTGKIVHSSVASIGTFTSSNGLLNQIQQAARNTLLNNTHGMITDTPTYEKNGWTGDAQASSLAAALNFDMARVWTKWMADFRDAQSPKGEIPEIVPTTSYYGYENTPGWNVIGGPVPSWDAATFVLPWDLYRQYGDVRILEEMYDTQKRLVDYTGTYINEANGYTYGNENNPFLGDYAGTGPYGPLDATAVAYYYYMVDRLAESAELLGRGADAATYRALAEAVRDAYNARYWDPDAAIYRSLDENGQAQPYAQTQNILPVAFGMAPAGSEAAIVKNLNDDIVSKGYHLTAGVFGIRHLMTMLSDYGYTDTAFQVATQRDEPSWGFWIENGHSTMFEGWSLDSRSYDHHYHGSISSWFYQSLAGIRPVEPGYETVRIQPRVPAGLEQASGSINTVRGPVESNWTHGSDGTFELNVVLPGNTSGEVWVPTAGGRATEEPAGATFSRLEPGYAVYTVGSGAYTFQSAF